MRRMTGAGTGKLWAGAGVLFVTLFVAKQGMWSMVSRQVKDITKDEHEKAVNSLQQSQASGRAFALKALSETQREQLRIKGALQSAAAEKDVAK